MFAFVVDGEQPFSVFDVSAGLREQGWLVPAYTFPKNREDIAALRIVVRNGFTHDLADLLLDDLRRVLARLQRQTAPARGPEAASFSHSVSQMAPGKAEGPYRARRRRPDRADLGRDAGSAACARS